MLDMSSFSVLPWKTSTMRKRHRFCSMQHSSSALVHGARETQQQFGGGSRLRSARPHLFRALHGLLLVEGGLLSLADHGGLEMVVSGLSKRSRARQLLL